MDEHVAWYRATIVGKVAKELEKNGFTAHRADSRAQASEQVLGIVHAGESVGFGGSQTIMELAVIEKLQARGHTVICQQPGLPREETIRRRREAVGADVYMASPNAVTMDGKLMLVDKIGNRAAGMVFGPRKVIAVAGFNKIVSDEEAGRVRIDTVAAPINAKRLGLRTPCGITGVCTDCDSPERMCGVAVTLMKRPTHTEYHVVLVNEDMGY